MKVLRTIVEEIFGLFVEDGSLAVGILVWLAVAAFAFPHVPGGTAWRAPLLFLGLLLLLWENVLRAAHRKRSG